MTAPSRARLLEIVADMELRWSEYDHETLQALYALAKWALAADEALETLLLHRLSWEDKLPIAQQARLAP